MNALPPIFAVTCSRECWFAIWRSEHDRTFDRRQLSATDLIVVSDAGPIAPELPSEPQRLVPRRPN